MTRTESGILKHKHAKLITIGVILRILIKRTNINALIFNLIYDTETEVKNFGEKSIEEPIIH